MVLKMGSHEIYNIRRELMDMIEGRDGGEPIIKIIELLDRLCAVLDSQQESGAGVGACFETSPSISAPPPPRYICDGKGVCDIGDSCSHGLAHEKKQACQPGKCGRCPDASKGFCLEVEVKADEPNELIIPPEMTATICAGCDAIIDMDVKTWAELRKYPEGTKMKITYGPVFPPQNEDNPGVIF